MIVTGGFVFLHLHKSGGRFVADCIRRHLSQVREIGYHLPGHLIPEASRRLPVIGLVRNPWSYYVSWYCYQQQRPQPNALFSVLSDGGRLDFTRTIHNMLDLAHDDTMLSQLLAVLPRQYGSQGLNLPGFALEPIRGSRTGFYSFLYNYMYSGTTGALHIGRMENLPGELTSLIEATGQPVSASMRDYLRAAPRMNVSDHGPYARYYDEALRARVAESDALLISRHAYRFEAASTQLLQS